MLSNQYLVCRSLCRPQDLEAKNDRQNPLDPARATGQGSPLRFPREGQVLSKSCKITAAQKQQIQSLAFEKISAGEISLTDFAVLAYILNATDNRTGICKVRVKTAAAKLRISESTYCRAYRKLKAAGLIEAEARVAMDGSKLANATYPILPQRPDLPSPMKGGGPFTGEGSRVSRSKESSSLGGEGISVVGKKSKIEHSFNSSTSDNQLVAARAREIARHFWISPDRCEALVGEWIKGGGIDRVAVAAQRCMALWAGPDRRNDFIEAMGRQFATVENFEDAPRLRSRII